MSTGYVKRFPVAVLQRSVSDKINAFNNVSNS